MYSSTLVLEQQQSHLVVVLDGREREKSRQLDSRIAFRAACRAEVEGCAHIDQEHDRELTLLDVALDVRRADPGGDVPVDGPDIVARNVRANLVELHAAAFEHRHVGAGEDVGHLPPGGHLDALDLANDVRGQQPTACSGLSHARGTPLALPG